MVNSVKHHKAQAFYNKQVLKRALLKWRSAIKKLRVSIGCVCNAVSLTLILFVRLPRRKQTAKECAKTLFLYGLLFTSGSPENEVFCSNE